MAVKRKSFDDWTAQAVRDTFQLQQVAATSLLQEWLTAVHAPNLQERAFLESKRALLEQFYRTWNEDELKFRFIAQIVELTSLIGVGYNTFTQRGLPATVNGVLLHGRPELMVASGREEPKKPYFFIHEYKPSRKSEDPLGQLLAAMLAAQTHNADGEPLFGCFVIGAIWQFLILDGQNYTLSRPFDATQINDLLNVYSALCQSKIYVEARL